MARGGYRPGAGRPKGAKSKPKDEVYVPPQETPLEYMLAVMNDPGADSARRDRMAIAAAPFVHPRKEPVGQGKREAADAAAKRASTGKFASAEPPKLIVNNQ